LADLVTECVLLGGEVDEHGPGWIRRPADTGQKVVRSGGPASGSCAASWRESVVFVRVSTYPAAAVRAVDRDSGSRRGSRLVVGLLLPGVALPTPAGG